VYARVMCVFGYMCECIMCVCVCVDFLSSVCLIACYSDSDSIVRSELGNGRFRFVPVMDPRYWWFED